MTSTATPSPSAEATEVPAVERIASGSFSAEIVPAIGGSLVAFYSSSGEPADRRDWLRPADTAALRGGSPLDMASFPLVPWCNRIRNGAFAWNGRRVELGPIRPDSPHAIHGIGWQRPWAVAGRGDDWIELVFDEPGHGAWPYPFEARQRYALAADGLSIHLSLRNTGNGA